MEKTKMKRDGDKEFSNPGPSRLLNHLTDIFETLYTTISRFVTGSTLQLLPFTQRTLMTSWLNFYVRMCL